MSSCSEKNARRRRALPDRPFQPGRDEILECLDVAGGQDIAHPQGRGLGEFGGLARELLHGAPPPRQIVRQGATGDREGLDRRCGRAARRRIDKCLLCRVAAATNGVRSLVGRLIFADAPR